MRGKLLGLALTLALALSASSPNGARASAPDQLVTPHASALLIQRLIVPFCCTRPKQLTTRTPGTISRITRDLNNLSIVPPSFKGGFCPADFGPNYRLRFNYRRSARSVMLDASGCTFVTSPGETPRWSYGSRSAFEDLTGFLALLTHYVSPHPTSIVTGGIKPCEGIILKNRPRYAAGTVTVLAGHAYLRYAGRGIWRRVFPTTVVARESVAGKHTYRFLLSAGSYVLRARFPPPANVVPFVNISVPPNRRLTVDIPNECL